MQRAAAEVFLPTNFAIQSTRQPEGIHVGIIMDGNGRWAKRRGLPRPAGHRAGARAVTAVVETARRAGVGTLTLYAFSADNWTRPEPEVTALMSLFRRALGKEAARCAEQDIRLEVIGRRDRLARALVVEIEGAEERTAGGNRMLLRLAVDYSSRAALAAAMRVGDRGGADVGERLRRAVNGRTAIETVDLVIRTGGEQRLSDFLLWEAAYAELFFTPLMWPDFEGEDLRAALGWFAARSRRYGGLEGSTAVAAGAP
jgi:undecaprenyl diphosphate synthase